MSQDISSTGISFRIVFSETYPNGVTVNEIADGTDPLDIPEVQIADAAMTANGDLVTWSAPKPIPVKIAVIPGSENDIALQYGFDANRAAKGKRVARDKLTFIGSYPDGGTVTLSGGKCMTYMPGRSATSAGRYKDSVYGMTFENIATTKGSGN
jgi:hypothetical protein